MAPPTGTGRKWAIGTINGDKLQHGVKLIKTKVLNQRSLHAGNHMKENTKQKFRWIERRLLTVRSPLVTRQTLRTKRSASPSAVGSICCFRCTQMLPCNTHAEPLSSVLDTIGSGKCVPITRLSKWKSAKHWFPWERLCQRYACSYWSESCCRRHCGNSCLVQQWMFEYTWTPEVEDWVKRAPDRSLSTKRYVH